MRDQITVLEALLTSARGKARLDVLRLAAQYAESAAWLYEDSGDVGRAQYWTDRAMQWAHETDDQLMVAWTMFRRSQLAMAALKAGDVIGLTTAARRKAGLLPAPMRAAILVRGHVKVAAGGRVEVTAGGQFQSPPVSVHGRC